MARANRVDRSTNIFERWESVLEVLFGLVLCGMGVFSICGAVFDWDFFMESRKARFWVNIVGRNGARVGYVVLGLGVAMLGLLITIGIIKDAS